MNNELYPIVSVIVPTFNCEKYLSETVESILNQTYKHWEALFVDDGSSDKTPSILKEFSYSDPRIRVYHRDVHPKGASTCRNIGIENSKGEYLVFLDSDDIIAPYCLEQRVGIMQKRTNLLLGIFRMQCFHGSINNLGKEFNKYSKGDPLIGFLSHELPWQTSCSIWRRRAFDLLHGFNPDYQRLQDVELHTRALLKGISYKIFTKSEIDCYYRETRLETRKRSKEFIAKVFHGFESYLKEFVPAILQSKIRVPEYKFALKRALMKFTGYSLHYFFKGDLSSNETKFYSNKLMVTSRDLGLINLVDVGLISTYHRCKLYGVLGASRILTPMFKFRNLR